MAGNSIRKLSGPSFGEGDPTPDPSRFSLKHVSDTAAYKTLDELTREKKVKPLPFPAPRGGTEPVLTLAEVLGGDQEAEESVQAIQAAGRLVFHSTGDIGNTHGPKTEEAVADKMFSDFDEADPADKPSFAFLLGDIVYSFGEAQYYYDQFYEPFRDYPAPILAVAGNHDGMPNPLGTAKTLEAFLQNFCAQGYGVSPDAGGLNRTAQVQPGVFFTFEAPFLRLIALYSNALENPGVIAGASIGSSQLKFLDAALKRVKRENFQGALVFAHHHPSYSTPVQRDWSVEMTRQMDQVCRANGVWPHAVLAGHAHNYQRFTRVVSGDGCQIPYIVCGNGGHGLQKLSKQGAALRAPQVVQAGGANADQVTLENYDDQNYGYLRVIADANQLRIEYHPASDGAQAKTPDDQVCVDLARRTLTQAQLPAPWSQGPEAPEDADSTDSAPRNRKARSRRSLLLRSSTGLPL